MSDLYRDLILDHWKNPHNFGTMKKPTIEIEEANPLCGDEIIFQFKIVKGKIAEIKFSGQGCALSQAGASILTDAVKGKNMTQVSKLTQDKFLEIIGIKPNPARLKCVLLPYKALKRGLDLLK